MFWPSSSQAIERKTAGYPHCLRLIWPVPNERVDADFSLSFSRWGTASPQLCRTRAVSFRGLARFDFGPRRWQLAEGCLFRQRHLDLEGHPAHRNALLDLRDIDHSVGT